jgi:heme exporter protein C
MSVRVATALVWIALGALAVFGLVAVSASFTRGLLPLGFFVAGVATLLRKDDPPLRVGSLPVPHSALGAVAIALSLASLYAIFVMAPVELQMGIVQKIFYFHVPSAYAMYLGAAVCMVGSIGYLASGKQVWDSAARAGAEVAVVMGLMVLITGPLWAAKAWGVFWTWDPRLTTSLLSVLVYVAYVVLRTFTGGGDAEKKFAAALGILGAANLPIIHLSVRKWGGTHPQVITGKGGGLTDPNMKLGLLFGFAAFTLLTVLLVWLRVRQDRAQARIDEALDEASALGLVDD